MTHLLPLGDAETICVVDSAVIAMALAILRPHPAVRYIYEEKRGIDDINPYRAAADVLLADVPMASKSTVAVPSPYFRPVGWRRFAFERSFRREIWSKIDRRQRFVGARTSSIMSVVPAAHKIYLDHGTGDYLVRSKQRLQPRPAAEWFKHRTKTLLGFSNHHTLPGARGYTMCLMAGDSYRHIDYRDLVLNAEVQAAMRPLKQQAEGTAPTLVMPTHPWHSSALDGNLLPYDELNLAMVRQHCRPSERLFIKWHPSLFLAAEIKTHLLDLLRQAGFSAIDVDQHLAPEFRGHIPAEVIVKACGIAKVVAEQSSVFYNLAHVPEIEKVNSALLFNRALHRGGTILSYYARLNPLLRAPLPVA